MTKHFSFRQLRHLLFVVVGCISFALGFNLFLEPNHINVGGVSGMGQLLEHITGFGSVALWSTIINMPLFLVSIKGVGRNFFLGSLLGMVLSIIVYSIGKWKKKMLTLA